MVLDNTVMNTSIKYQISDIITGFYHMPLTLYVKWLPICDQFVVTFWCSYCTYLSYCLSRSSHCVWLYVE